MEASAAGARRNVRVDVRNEAPDDSRIAPLRQERFAVCADLFFQHQLLRDRHSGVAPLWYRFEFSLSVGVGRTRRIGMAKVLVTGSTGNVGSQLVPRLLSRGHSVRAFVLKGDKSGFLRGWRSPKATWRTRTACATRSGVSRMYPPGSRHAGDRTAGSQRHRCGQGRRSGDDCQAFGRRGPVQGDRHRPVAPRRRGADRSIGHTLRFSGPRRSRPTRCGGPARSRPRTPSMPRSATPRSRWLTRATSRKSRLRSCQLPDTRERRTTSPARPRSRPQSR